MPEKKIELKTYTVEYICDECGEGKMKCGNSAYATNPPGYPHKCDKCGHSQTFWGVYYPRSVQEKIVNNDSIETIEDQPTVE